MVILTKTFIREFSKKHPAAKTALLKWYEETSAAKWRDFSDVKRTFNTVDAVSNNRYVFILKATNTG